MDNYYRKIIPFGQERLVRKWVKQNKMFTLTDIVLIK